MNNTMLSSVRDPIALNNRYTAQYDRLDNYNDLNALQSIKYQSKSDKAGALDQAAKHFESIFVSMMIKSMRDANKVFSEGNMLNSSESEFYQQMFDSQLAVSLSTGKGIGLAEVIKRQLSKDLNVPTRDLPPEGLPLAGQRMPLAEGQMDEKFSLDHYKRLPFVSPQKAVALDETVESIDQIIQARPKEQDSVAIENHVAEPKVLRFASPQAFINSLYPLAKEVEQQTGIDARLMLAQSALETGWGKYPIVKEDGSPSFNLFGIKANSSWQGEAARITTTEYRSGVAMTEKANFRAYSGYQESFQDYARFLQSNARYQHALTVADQPKVFAQELQQAGYATDPAYADKINRIMDRYMSGLDTKTDPDKRQHTILSSGSHEVTAEPKRVIGQEG